MKARLDYLDSIRGIAATLVLFAHLLGLIYKESALNFLFVNLIYENINLGRVGVIVFFITSGFVITWSLSQPAPHALKNFAIKRFFRLYPAYWFSILLAVLAYAIFDNLHYLHIESFSQVIFNFTMIHKYLGVGSVIDAYWTLHLELVFYFICAGLFYFSILNNRYTVYLILLSLVIAMFFAFVRYKYSIKVPIVMPLGLASIFYGSIVRSWLIDKNKDLKLTVLLLTLLFFIMLFVAQKMYYLDGWAKWYVTYIVAFCLFYSLITICKLHSKIFIYIGRISYSLYLLHPIVISLLIFFWWENTFTSLSLMIFCALAVVLSFAVASFSYHFIEKPSLVLSSKFKFKKHELIVLRVN
jgi:peptidoglycan/LPS O-acetylase OafA/YrhL